MTTCYLNFRADNNTHTIVAGENPYRNVPTLSIEHVNTVFGSVPGDVINFVDHATYEIAGRRSLSDYQYDSPETAASAHAACLGDSALVR